MTMLGWLVMLVSVGGVTVFLLWCVIKVLSNRDTASHIHSTADIEPTDLDRD
ncbi:MAG: hypothetical protein JJU36_07740 [Phycisphaeraceae bacterium]|nr:hypothetical protein [Phycisphaeraceae bacterium]